MEVKESRKRLSPGPKEFPVGWRFAPTDEELVNDYLMNKVLYKPLPAHVAEEIDATDLYSKPPWDLVANDRGLSSEREWFFYVHGDEEGKICEKIGRTKDRIVGYEKGFWRLDGNEDIPNPNGPVVASKSQLTYFKGSPLKPKKTFWKMEEYRLCCGSSDDDDLDSNVENWALGRIRRGIDYGNIEAELMMSDLID